MSWNFGEIEIKVEYKDYIAIFYEDYFREVDEEYTFYNLEIYKDKKCLRHSTLDKKPTKLEVENYLKSFVDKQTSCS